MGNKKLNTVIFMVAATLLNLALLLVFFIIGFVLLSLAMGQWPNMPEWASAVSVLLVFVFAIGLTFFIYNKIIKWVTVKYNLEEKLYLFSRRNRK